MFNDYGPDDFDTAVEYDDATDAYRGGKRAYERGIGKEDNPFSDSQLAFKWNCGWHYGQWEATGEAFGEGPAKGTLARQQKVSGFLGKGLVNTFLGGDRPHHEGRHGLFSAACDGGKPLPGGN